MKNRIPKYILYLLCLILQGIDAMSQVTVNRTTCRRMAVENSIPINIARQQKQKADNQYKAYHAKYFPEISAAFTTIFNQKDLNYELAGGYSPTFSSDQNGNKTPNYLINPATNQPYIGPDGLPIFTEYALIPNTPLDLDLRTVYDFGIAFKQPIYLGGKIKSAVQSAEIGQTMAYQNLRLQETDIIYETDKAYFQLLQAQESVLLSVKYMALIQEVLSQIKNAQDVGLSMTSDVLQVEVKQNEALLMNQEANHAQKLASMNLARLLGLNLETPIIAVDSLNGRVNPNIWTYDSVPNLRPDYRLLEENIQLQNEKIQIARAPFLPQVGLEGGYYYTGGIKLNGDTDAQASFRAFATVNIPITNWGEGKNKIRNAKIEQQISEYQLQQANQLMQLDIKSARFAITNAQTKIKIAQKGILDANENLRIATNEYRTGFTTLSDLLEAQVNWQKAQNQWIFAKTELMLSETAYLKALGVLTASLKDE